MKNPTVLQKSFLVTCSSIAIIFSLGSDFIWAAREPKSKPSIGKPAKWQPHVNVNMKAGTKRHIGQIGFIAPLYQKEGRLLYADLRFMGDTKKAREGNFGLGHRWMINNDQQIAGVYGFFDRRQTEMGNNINQLTVGAELLSNTWDYRANVYLPQKKTKTVNRGPDESKIRPVGAGHSVVDYVPAKIQKEVPQAGFDLEVGRSMPGYDPLKIYGTYYHFAGRDGAKAINGGRLRGKLEFNEYVALDLEGSRDNVRKSVGFIGLSFKIPLGGPENKPNLTTLEKRMTEAPQRDIDIVALSHDMAPDYSGPHVEKRVRKHQAVFFTEQPVPAGYNESLADGTAEKPFYLKHNYTDARVLVLITDCMNQARLGEVPGLHEKWHVHNLSASRWDHPIPYAEAQRKLDDHRHRFAAVPVAPPLHVAPAPAPAAAASAVSSRRSSVSDVSDAGSLSSAVSSRRSSISDVSDAGSLSSAVSSRRSSVSDASDVGAFSAAAVSPSPKSRSMPGVPVNPVGTPQPKSVPLQLGGTDSGSSAQPVDSSGIAAHLRNHILKQQAMAQQAHNAQQEAASAVTSTDASVAAAVPVAPPMAPPMAPSMTPAPSAPLAPPLPSSAASSSKSAGLRQDLLASIQAGKGLRKTVTVDKSQPMNVNPEGRKSGNGAAEKAAFTTPQSGTAKGEMAASMGAGIGDIQAMALARQARAAAALAQQGKYPTEPANDAAASSSGAGQFSLRSVAASSDTSSKIVHEKLTEAQIQQQKMAARRAAQDQPAAPASTGEVLKQEGDGHESEVPSVVDQNDQSPRTVTLTESLSRRASVLSIPSSARDSSGSVSSGRYSLGGFGSQSNLSSLDGSSPFASRTPSPVDEAAEAAEVEVAEQSSVPSAPVFDAEKYAKSQPKKEAQSGNTAGSSGNVADAAPVTLSSSEAKAQLLSAITGFKRPVGASSSYMSIDERLKAQREQREKAVAEPSKAIAQAPRGAGQAGSIEPKVSLAVASQSSQSGESSATATVSVDSLQVLPMVPTNQALLAAAAARASKAASNSQDGSSGDEFEDDDNAKAKFAESQQRAREAQQRQLDEHNKKMKQLAEERIETQRLAREKAENQTAVGQSGEPSQLQAAASSSGSNTLTSPTPDLNQLLMRSLGGRRASIMKGNLATLKKATSQVKEVNVTQIESVTLYLHVVDRLPSESNLDLSQYQYLPANAANHMAHIDVNQFDAEVVKKSMENLEAHALKERKDPTVKLNVNWKIEKMKGLEDPKKVTSSLRTIISDWKKAREEAEKASASGAASSSSSAAPMRIAPRFNPPRAGSSVTITEILTPPRPSSSNLSASAVGPVPSAATNGHAQAPQSEDTPQIHVSTSQDSSKDSALSHAASSSISGTTQTTETTQTTQTLVPQADAAPVATIVNKTRLLANALRRKL